MYKDAVIAYTGFNHYHVCEYQYTSHHKNPRANSSKPEHSTHLTIFCLLRLRKSLCIIIKRTLGFTEVPPVIEEKILSRLLRYFDSLHSGPFLAGPTKYSVQTASH